MCTRATRGWSGRVAGWVLLCLLCAAACGQTGSPAGASSRFAGSWWLHSGADERLGFLHALSDCLTYDAKPPLTFKGTWEDFDRAITGVYKGSAANRSSSVQQVFERFGMAAKGSGHYSDSDRFGDEFWRQNGDAVRTGFVEGYIACRSAYPNPPRWSKPISFYLGRLNDMYNAEDRHGENAPEYAGSVASALGKLSDKR